MIAGQPSAPATGVFHDRTGWYLGISAYWFATSFKWFVLFLLLPVQVAAIVPGGEKNSWWGLVVSVGAVEAMVGPALFGWLSDRSRFAAGRRRPFLAIGAACTAVALLYLGTAESLWQMVLGYLFLQISDDIGTGPYSALVPDLVPEERRGRASGVMGLLQLMAQVAAAATGILLGSSFFKIYLAIAIVNIVCALIVLLVVREAPAESLPPPVDVSGMSVEARVRGAVRAWLAPWESADFRWVWFTRFLNAFGFYLILLYMVNYLTDRVRVFDLFVFSIGTPLVASIALALVISLSGAAASVCAGKMADRIGRKRVIISAGWLMFCTLVPFALIPVYWLILLLAIPFGVGYGAYVSASWALASDVMPNPEDTARDMGMWQMSVATPQILTGLAGTLVDVGNRMKMGFGYSFTFLIASLAFLFGCTLVSRIRGSS